MVREVVTASPVEPVLAAAERMFTHDVSCVVVMEVGQAVGIFSQQDVVTRVLSLRKNPARTPAVEVMSKPVLPVPPDYSVFLASRIMMEKMRIHRLVVQDGRCVCGIVSQTDVLRAVQRRLAEEEKHREFLICSDLPLFLLDGRLKVAYVNSAFLRLSELEAFGHVVGSSFSDARFWGTPEDHRHIAHALGMGQSGSLGMTIRTPGGLTKRVVLVLAATRTALGAVRGWQGVVWDVTDRAAVKASMLPSPGADPAGTLPCGRDRPGIPKDNTGAGDKMQALRTFPEAPLPVCR